MRNKVARRITSPDSIFPLHPVGNLQVFSLVNPSSAVRAHIRNAASSQVGGESDVLGVLRLAAPFTGALELPPSSPSKRINIRIPGGVSGSPNIALEGGHGTGPYRSTLLGETLLWLVPTSTMVGGVSPECSVSESETCRPVALPPWVAVVVSASCVLPSRSRTGYPGEMLSDGTLIATFDQVLRGDAVFVC
ncbi:hypothetical protein K466DRAFT_599497 [Polyporus arcularius HHB13444]|uniref:Uncharacterized protein n=1 Tax=Polyporus arcularius HHB13444 TaxID=1314778 RepID=A0A5C3PCU8_9APHY|nr:hypothetical protein K466DRAFT_599497 [Polyporus arcularius HHB13444]